VQHKPQLSRRLAITAAIKSYTKKSLNKMSELIGIPKSSVYRENTNRKKRISSVGHEFFETEQGAVFLSRLIVSVITVFGIKENVGADTISLFFESALLSFYVACSPSKLREIKNTVRGCIETFGEEELTKVLKLCQTTDLTLGADETKFDDEMVLLLMELQSGFIITEVISTDRKESTWSIIRDQV